MQGIISGGGASLSGKLSCGVSLSGNTGYSSCGGTTDYNKLTGKPKINGTELIGDKSSEEIGIHEISNIEILKIINGGK